MRRKRSHMVGGIVELLGVRMRIAEDYPALALFAHRNDVLQQCGQPRSNRRILGPTEGEDHITGCYRDAILPPRPGVEIEDESHRVPASPGPCQQWYKAAISSGRQGRSQPCQTKKELIGQLYVSHIRCRPFH